MKRLSEHLYVYQDTCQVYVIVDQGRAVLIDFGSGEVLEKLEEIGVDQVTDILITHHHRDQLQGLSKAKVNLIKIWVPNQEQDLIAEAEELWQRREVRNNYNNRQDRFSILESVDITGTLKDYSVLSFNGKEFRIIPTPGHTTGSISIATRIDGENVCFSGDLIYPGGKLWSLAATQWSYNGGEGIPYHILSLLTLKEYNFTHLYPSHGESLITAEDIDQLIDMLTQLMKLRKQNPRLLLLREKPYEPITEHVLLNRTSMANSYVLLSESKKAMIIDFGYDFMAGIASGSDRSSRRPWLYTIPKLMEDYQVTGIDACIPTHYHDDHVAGMNLLRETYQTRILCPENFADLLEHPTNYDLPCLWYDPIQVDQKLPINQSFQWEEYEITLHELPGHTKYAVAIEFSADGNKFLCTGDQYADGDGLFGNYVYKNIFAPEDYVRSAQLLERIQPDIILSGHWPMLHYTAEYQAKLEELGRNISRLHRAILPEAGYVSDKKDFVVEMHPYEVTVAENDPFQVIIDVTNQYAQKKMAIVHLTMPEGFQGRTYFEEEVPAGKTVRITTEITAPKGGLRRARIGCDLSFSEKRLGEQAEMLVTVMRKN